MKFMIYLFMILSLIMIASAVETLQYQTNENIDLKIPCILNNTNCPAGTGCNISIISPNSSVFTSGPMTYNPTYFNYTLGILKNSGQYQANMVCAKNTKNGYTNFIINIQGLSDNRCPADFNLIWFIGGLLALFILISLIFKWSFVGIITAIGMLFLGFTLLGCSMIFGSLIIGLGLLLMAGFSFMKWI